jgi:hypothetical protein
MPSPPSSSNPEEESGASEPQTDGGQTTAPNPGETGQPGAPGDSASSEDLINAGETLLEAASDLRRGAQAADDPLLPEPMNNASPGGEPEDSLIPESEPTRPADEETFFETDPASTSSAATETETEVDPPDNSSAPGAEASAAAGEALNQGGEIGDSSEDESLTAGQQAALEAAADAVAAAGEALLRAADEMSDSKQGSDSIGNGDPPGSESMSEAQIALILARAALDEAAASNDGDPRSGQWIDAANASIDIASEALAGAVQAATMEGRGTDHDASESGRTADVTGAGHSGPDARIAELDAELDASIVVFETDMQSARERAAAALTGRTMTAVAGSSLDVDETSIGQEDRLPEGTASVGTPGMAPDENPDVEATNGEDSDGEYAETGRTPDGKRFEGPPPTEDPEIPEDIPSPQGDDIVAKQLREAAMAEQDPDLKAKLWEEYKRYKAGL